MEYKGIALSNHNRRRKFQFDKWNKELAYLSGVYLGDGSVCFTQARIGHNKNNAYFQVSAIDGDFIKKVKKCAKCGSKKNLTADHIKELKDGGKTELPNLQWLCITCHKQKTIANGGW